MRIIWKQGTSRIAESRGAALRYGSIERSAARYAVRMTARVLGYIVLMLSCTAGVVEAQPFSFVRFAAWYPTFHIDSFESVAGAIRINMLLVNWERRYPAPAMADRANIISNLIAPDCWGRGGPSNPDFPDGEPGFIGGSTPIDGLTKFGFCTGVSSNEDGPQSRDLYDIWPDGVPGGVFVDLPTRCANVPGCDPDTLQVETTDFMDDLRSIPFNARSVFVDVADWDEGESFNLRVSMWSQAPGTVLFPFTLPFKGVHLIRLPPGTPTGSPSPGVVVGNPAVGPWPEGTLFLHNPSWDIPDVATIGVLVDGGGPFVTPRETPVTSAKPELDRNDDVDLDDIDFPPPSETEDGGIFTIHAHFRNTLPGAIGDLCFRVRELSGGAVRLDNANLPGPGGVGVALCVGRLEPDATTWIAFDVQLTSPKRRFTLLVDAFDNSVGPEVLFDTAFSVNLVNMTQTVRTSVFDEAGQPVVGSMVTFEITSPNRATLILNGTTDQNGLATIDYSRSQVGVDTIRVVFTDLAGISRTTGEQFVEWQ